MNYIESLTTIGLTSNEAAVYVALVELGESTAQMLAKETGIKRPTVYVTLESLRIKEAILKVPQSKKALYIAKPPRELLEQHLTEVDKTAQAIPKLEAIYKKDGRANISYFDGLKGIVESMEYKQTELSDTEIVAFWGKVDAWDPRAEDLTVQWTKRSAKLGTTVRAIIPDHPSLDKYKKTDKQFGREMRVVPMEKYSSDATVEVTDLFVRIMDFKRMQAVIIESPDFVKSIQQIFEMVWEGQTEGKES